MSPAELPRFARPHRGVARVVIAYDGKQMYSRPKGTFKRLTSCGHSEESVGSERIVSCCVYCYILVGDKCLHVCCMADFMTFQKIFQLCRIPDTARPTNAVLVPALK